jgi:hypothetical protein
MAHIRDDADDLGGPSEKAPLVDCMSSLSMRHNFELKLIFLPI